MSENETTPGPGQEPAKPVDSGVVREPAKTVDAAVAPTSATSADDLAMSATKLANEHSEQILQRFDHLLEKMDAILDREPHRAAPVVTDIPSPVEEISGSRVVETIDIPILPRAPDAPRPRPWWERNQWKI